MSGNQPITDLNSGECLHQTQVGSVRASVWLSEDRLTLYLEAEDETKSEPETLAPERIPELLGPLSEKLVISDDLSRSLSEQLAKEKRFQKTCIAAGKAPERGQSGRIDYTVQSVPGTLTDDACIVKPIVFKKLGIVQKGDLIAIHYPPTTGQAGKDALGSAIPGIRGDDAPSLETDKNISKTKLDAEGTLEYKANIAGALFEQNGRLGIAKKLIIDGHVTVHSGPLDFIGDVDVRGNIMKGLYVHADGNIVVQEDIYGGSLASRNGCITLLGHLSGEQESRIVAAKNITVELAQEASLESGGDIIANTEVRDCSIQTSGRLLVPTGHVLGGNIRARYGVEASTIGSLGGSATRIFMLQEVSSSDAFRGLASTLREHEHGLTRFENALGALAGYTDEQIEEDKHQIAPLIPAIHSYRQLKESKKSLEEEMEALLAKDRKRVNFRVNFLNEIHPGVRIVAGKAVYVVPETIPGPGTIEYLASKNLFHIGEHRKLSEPERK